MNWFWKGKNETRQDTSYTDTLIAALVSSARGETLALPTATAALESCAGLIGRMFAAAEVKARPAIVGALTPECLMLIGRSLMRRGELVLYMDTAMGLLRLLPAETWDVQGPPQPELWEYRLTLGGPSETMTYNDIPATSVIHPKYAVDAERPWRGNGPIQVATLAGTLSANTVKMLADEASGPVGRLLGLPIDGEDATVAKMKSDLANAKGKLALLETGDWNNPGGGMVSLKTERFGAEPPASLIEQADLARREVYSACGLSEALWAGSQAASVREAYRLALFSVCAPLGRLVESELSAKLEDDVKLEWSELRSADVQGRARALNSMVSGGMALEQAVQLSGLLIED